MDRNIWKDGIMGLVAGDALGVPVEFMKREMLKNNPVTDMREYGTYNLPKGSWSDDSSMTLATLNSLKNGYDPEDMMKKFVLWMTEGAYTPHGECFDIGNGSLMRILPTCLYFFEKQKQDRLRTLFLYG